MTTAWHVADHLARRYAAGTAPETDAWSLEKHVESCAPCARRVTAAVRERGAAAPLLDEIRAAVLATAAAEAEGVSAERVPVADPWRRMTGARRFGRVLWAAGPAFRGGWLGALLLVVGAAVALAFGGGPDTQARPVLLLLAPVLPVAGVGLSYGRSADPMHEIIATSPGGGLRLLLVRTAAVLGTAVPVTTLAWAVLPASAGGPGALSWLLPGLALTLAALSLGSYVGCRAGSWAVAAAWAAAVTVPGLGSSHTPLAEAARTAARLLSGTPAQGAWAAAAVLGAGLLALRRRSFDHLETS
ncbi:MULTISPECIES: hypothetical protein [unclassified Streptomyces]|uniref:hypothetical protein n=1 Tax=unclassified Streptomyces TaxID=2593676 RepID=UPI000DAF41FE|nr:MULTISPECIES: hypothetical protein [unclassified Streptomyces]PZT76625.1 hypothetical protein DNK56_25305 [Streptomyces sp. AC1-42W]PZT79418.1 hypothetical protein DNK55_07375 [Streptomyces sp. AC1-42T]